MSVMKSAYALLKMF